LWAHGKFITYDWHRCDDGTTDCHRHAQGHRDNRRRVGFAGGNASADHRRWRRNRKWYRRDGRRRYVGHVHALLERDVLALPRVSAAAERFALGDRIPGRNRLAGGNRLSSAQRFSACHWFAERDRFSGGLGFAGGNSITCGDGITGSRHAAADTWSADRDPVALCPGWCRRQHRQPNSGSD
jgi:hypothetical protein